MEVHCKRLAVEALSTMISGDDIVWSLIKVKGDILNIQIGLANLFLNVMHNNNLLGACIRPVMFTKLIRKCIDGEEVDILVADREFFDRLRYDCTRCRSFYAVIATCIEFGDVRPIFLADRKGCECGRLLPLTSARNGFIIHADWCCYWLITMRSPYVEMRIE